MATHSSTLAWKIPWTEGLVGYSPWGREESDTTERLHFHFSLSCIGEGNGNPLQCSCLENPRDGGAWWAAVYGVAQSRKRLKQLSSSSSSSSLQMNVFPHVTWKHCKYYRMDRAGKKSLEVGRENLPADYPSSLQPGAKEAKATLCISLKASQLHRGKTHPWRPMAPMSWPVSPQIRLQ